MRSREPWRPSLPSRVGTRAHHLTWRARRGVRSIIPLALALAPRDTRSPSRDRHAGNHLGLVEVDRGFPRERRKPKASWVRGRRLRHFELATGGPSHLDDQTFLGLGARPTLNLAGPSVAHRGRDTVPCEPRATKARRNEREKKRGKKKGSKDAPDERAPIDRLEAGSLFASTADRRCGP